MTGTERTLGALGIAAGAGKLIFGTPQICEALKGGRKPRLVLMASDNSENTAKRLADRCAFYHVRLVKLKIDADRLSSAVGKSGRIAAVAVSDENMCRLIVGTLSEEEHNV